MTEPSGAPISGGAADHNGHSPDARGGEDVRLDNDAATIDALRARIAELEDRWRRAAADLDNVRKRSARDAVTQRADERNRVTAALLPVLDNLDLALEHADADPQSVIAGVRAVRDQAADALAALGFARDDDTGVPFDPARHEAVAVVNDPAAAPGTIVRVVRPGYGDGDHQLRPASVVVSSGVGDGR
ncbi:MAG TPA: nucleotide exchange factor GrpE [Micromonosporaceae bacterium]|nr:nucleotide exchange factor GrpE [Micromonosporaceae bacterium]